MGLKVLPPDVNDSDRDFTPRGTDIRFGLGAIRNVGANVVDSLVRTRKAKGRFGDFADFLRKVEPVACNKRTVESLIKAGAFDSLGHPRRGLVQIHAEVIDAALRGQARRGGRAVLAVRRARHGGGRRRRPDADAALETTIPNGEWDKKLLLAYEREMLGLYVSDHPLLGVEHIIAAGSDATVADLAESCDDGQIVTVGGIVASITRKVTKTGSPWAVVQLEDLDGGVETLFFPQTYADGLPPADRGRGGAGQGPRRQARGGAPADRDGADRPRPDPGTARPADGLAGGGPVRPGSGDPAQGRAVDASRHHRGAAAAAGAARVTTLRLDDGLRVSVSTSLVADLKELLGAGCVSG